MWKIHCTLRKFAHLNAKLFFFLPFPRNPLFPIVACVEFELELLTVESLSLSSSSSFACFPPLSSSTSDPVPSISTGSSCWRDDGVSSVIAKTKLWLEFMFCSQWKAFKTSRYTICHIHDQTLGKMSRTFYPVLSAYSKEVYLWKEVSWQRMFTFSFSYYSSFHNKAAKV